MKITLKKSLIGSTKDQIATAASLGLKKVGKVKKIGHLIQVEK